MAPVHFICFSWWGRPQAAGLNAAWYETAGLAGRRSRPCALTSDRWRRALGVGGTLRLGRAGSGWEVVVGAFEDLHRGRVTGSLDFTAYAKSTTERIATNARKLATDAGRPVISFDHVKTRNRTQHKDELAKSIAEADGITEGIICLISAGESCFSFQVRKRLGTGRLELSRRERKCLHHPSI